jgi:hypothetical protein
MPSSQGVSGVGLFKKEEEGREGFFEEPDEDLFRSGFRLTKKLSTARRTCR